jgi:hypothetical protein
LKAFVRATLSVLQATFTVIGAIAVILIIAWAIYLRVAFPPPLSQKANEEIFIKNRHIILLATHYLINNDDYSIYISGRELKEGAVIIEDTQVADAMKTLFSESYSVISKDGNIISFMRHTEYMSFESGIAYIIDVNEPHIEYATKLEPMSEPNWYYYESDLNEYKRRYQSDE